MKTPEEIESSVSLIESLASKPINASRAYSLLMHRCFEDLERDLSLLSSETRKLNTRKMVEEYINPKAAERVFKQDALVDENIQLIPESAEFALARCERVFSYLHEHADPSVSQYSRMMSTYVKLGRLSESLGVYRKFVDSDHRPDSVVLNTLLETFMKGAYFDGGLKVFKSMRDRKNTPDPDVHTYRIMMKYLCSSGDPKDLETAKQIILDRKAGRLTQDTMGTHVFSRIIAAYGYLDEHSHVQELLQTMKDREIRISTSVFNSVIGPLCLRNNADEVLRLLDGMKEDGATANKLTITMAFENLRKHYLEKCEEIENELYFGKKTEYFFDQLSTMKPIATFVKVVDKSVENFTDLQVPPHILIWILDAVATELKRGEKLSPSNADAKKMDEVRQIALLFYNACIEHGLRFKPLDSRLGLKLFETAEGVLLVLESVLWEIKRNPINLANQGLWIFVSKESISHRVRMAISKFRPPLVVRDSSDKLSFFITRSSILRWKRTQNCSGWFSKDSTTAAQLSDLIFSIPVVEENEDNILDGKQKRVAKRSSKRKQKGLS